MAHEAAGGLGVALGARAARLVRLAEQLAQQADAHALPVVELAADRGCRAERGVNSRGGSRGACDWTARYEAQSVGVGCGRGHASMQCQARWVKEQQAWREWHGGGGASDGAKPERHCGTALGAQRRGGAVQAGAGFACLAAGEAAAGQQPCYSAGLRGMARTGAYVVPVRVVRRQLLVLGSLHDVHPRWELELHTAARCVSTGTGDRAALPTVGPDGRPALCSWVQGGTGAA